MHEALIQEMEKGRLYQAEKIINDTKPEDFIDLRRPEPPKLNRIGQPIPPETAFKPHPSPFHKAAELGQNYLVELMLSKNSKLSDYIPYESHSLALYYPARDGNVELVKLILSRMSSQVIIDNQNGLVNSSFQQALTNKHEKVLEALLANSNVVKTVNTSNNGKIMLMLEENGYYKLSGVISPEILINMLNPKDKAPDPKCAESLYKAIFAYDIDINYQREVAENYYRKGNILYVIGKKEDALKSYNKAIAIDRSYAAKVTLNIEELLDGSAKGNSDLRSFVDYINDHRTIDTSDLETKEESDKVVHKISTIQLADEEVQQKSKFFSKVIKQLKDKVSQIFNEIEELETSYNEFLEDLYHNSSPEGEGDHLEIQTSTELMGGTCAFDSATSL